MQHFLNRDFHSLNIFISLEAFSRHRVSKTASFQISFQIVSHSTTSRTTVRYPPTIGSFSGLHWKLFSPREKMTKLAIYSLTWIYACVTIAAPSTDVSTHNRVIILIFTMMILIYCLKASHKRRFGNFNKFPVRLTTVNRFNTRDICYLSRKKKLFSATGPKSCCCHRDGFI